MNIDLSQKAVNAALSGNWERAEEMNRQILNVTPNDVDALNRLAKAYYELSDIKKAKLIANKVVKIDPFNKIALKSLEKWNKLKGGSTKGKITTSPSAFLEEPGKTKIVTLLHPGSSKAIANLDAGERVKLNDHGHRMSISTIDSKYLGKLPDDISARLKKLIGFGNEYEVFVKSADKKEVKVFIRETKRAKQLSDMPSFTGEKIDYISFTPPELVHERDRGPVESESEYDE
jgi:tetratricopeptide (TPR) repeat protein